MIKCPKCSKELNNTTKFCDECGASTKQISLQSNNIKNGLLGCGGLIAIIVAIIFAVSMCTSSKKNAEPPEHNTNAYVLYLIDQAEENSKDVTSEELQGAVDWFKSHKNAFCGGTEIMEKTIYYGLLLSNKYKGTNNEYEKIGSRAFVAVSQVYTDGVDALRDENIKSQIDELNYMAENISDIILSPTPDPITPPPAEKLVEPTEHGTTDYVDYITYKAKNDSINATEEQLQEAVVFLRNNINSYFSSQEHMEKTMYYGELLEYKYKNTGNVYEKAGLQAYNTVKYVYRGIDNTTDESTSKNLSKLQEMALALPDLK